MFKSSIQWKILALFIILTISVMSFVGVFSSWGISKYYHEQFAEDMKVSTFTQSMVNQLASASEKSFEDMTSLLEKYSIRMGIDSYREAYVISGRDASCLYSVSGKTYEGDMEITENIIAALAGKVGDDANPNEEFMDFAVPIVINGETEYIIYVTDSKVEMYEVMRSILSNIFLSLAIGLFISIVLGFVLSKMLISPIKKLQSSATHMAEGNFSDKIPVSSTDEIGHLTEAFNYMADELNYTMSEMSAEKNKIETVLHYMTDGVIAFNSDGNLIHINPVAKKLLGMDANEIGSFDEFFGRLGTGINIGHFLYLEKEPDKLNIDFGERHFLVDLAPLVSDGKTVGVVSVFHDYTKQQKLDNARREFVANVSHELRTPITVIKSYAETLMDYREHDETEKSFLNVIDEETERMIRLIKDLLSLSRLDNNSEMKKEPFDLKALVDLACKRMSIEAKENNQSIECTIKDEFIHIKGDRDRIEQVIVNIIGNAIKYNRKGGKIQVFCSTESSYAKLMIKDNGIGIPKEDIPRLFERFYRVDKARSRSKGGTGLGLAIAKEIVDAHNGSINIESEEGKGTLVTIKLPLS